MFSKQATDKFGEVFTAIFAMQKEVERKGGLDTADVTVTPKQLTVGKPQPLTVVGTGFSNDTTATMGGDKRTFVASSRKQGNVMTEPKDVTKAGTIELTITNRGNTYKFPITVVASSENAADGVPVISSTAPEPLTKAGPRSLDVIGEGLSGGSATINGETRNVTPVDDTKIRFALQDKDFATTECCFEMSQHASHHATTLCVIRSVHAHHQTDAGGDLRIAGRRVDPRPRAKLSHPIHQDDRTRSLPAAQAMCCRVS